MIIKDAKLGECEVEVCVEYSSVDSYLIRGSSVTLDRDLTDDELDYLQDTYNDQVQEYSWQNGSRNHN